MNLSVKIADILFKNPVTVASGTYEYIKEYLDIKKIRQFGAYVPKTVTLHAQEGNPPMRIMETASGMLNAIGLDNNGVDYFIKNKLPNLKKIGIPLIVSYSAKTDEDFITITEKFNKEDGISAYELNLSCPNLKQSVLVSQSTEATARLVTKLKKVSRVPLIAKLSPNVTDIAEIAKSAEDAGANAVSMINTFSAMAIDIDSKKPVLGNVEGGLSGPAIRPIAVYMVYKTAKRIKIPVIAMGGIMNAHDALEFLIAGATMVAVGTANYINPYTPCEVIAGIKDYMRKHKIKEIKDIIGSIQG